MATVREQAPAGTGMCLIATLSVASVRSILLASHDNGGIKATMANLRQPQRQVATEMSSQGSSSSGWDRYDLVCGVYLLLVLIAFTMTGVALARGDLPSEKIPNQITGN